jgi:hypothetical protein
MRSCKSFPYREGPKLELADFGQESCRWESGGEGEASRRGLRRGAESF